VKGNHRNLYHPPIFRGVGVWSLYGIRDGRVTRLTATVVTNVPTKIPTILDQMSRANNSKGSEIRSYGAKNLMWQPAPGSMPDRFFADLAREEVKAEDFLFWFRGLPR
jgi:hypothetical protein